MTGKNEKATGTEIDFTLTLFAKIICSWVAFEIRTNEKWIGSASKLQINSDYDTPVSGWICIYTERLEGEKKRGKNSRCAANEKGRWEIVLLRLIFLVSSSIPGRPLSLINSELNRGIDLPIKVIHNYLSCRIH